VVIGPSPRSVFAVADALLEATGTDTPKFAEEGLRI
jgi:hypothetical protein